MTPIDVAAILVVLAAAFGYLNHRLFGLPHAIGLTIMGAVASIAVVAVDTVVPALGLGRVVRAFITSIDFRTALMDGMLAFLLFAGALHVDLPLLLRRKWAILSLATVGVLISTVIIGVGFKGLSLALGLDVPLLWCLVFGALISPTDPVAVLGILKSANVPASLEAKIAGESLFNDGVGIVVFSILLAAALGAGDFSLAHAAELFLIEAVGGAVFGLVLGWIGFKAMQGIDEPNLEVLITLALVMGGYALAQTVHVSGPVAMAVAGLLIGNHGVSLAMSERTREHVLRFWSLIDEVLNSVLFLLIGLEVVAIAVQGAYLVAGIAAIALELFLIEAVGGAVFGLVLGWIGFKAMQGIDEPNLEVLITLALVMGGYALAQTVHVSGPVAMAVAGLLIGNHGVSLAMSERTREHVLRFWSLIDEVLNSVLFLLIGLEVVAIAVQGAYLVAGVAAIALVLVARAVAVGLPMAVLSRFSPFTRGAYPVMVWGGLRGGISIALALALPEGPMKDLILTVTYVVVVFSVIVQGATVGKVARRILARAVDEERP